MKKNRGITLIALVITIIILLILAGVAISMITGGEGLLTKTKDTKNRYTHASVYEALQVEAQNYQYDLYAKETDKNLIGYLEEKEVIKESTKNLNEYIVNVEKLSGKKIDLGNGTDEQTDVYKLIARQSLAKLASVSITQLALDGGLSGWELWYFGINGEEPIKLGTLEGGKEKEGAPTSDKFFNYVINNEDEVEITGINLSKFNSKGLGSDYPYTEFSRLNLEKIIVPSEINGKTVTKVSFDSNSDKWLGSIIGVKEIVYPDTVVEIANCSNITFGDVEKIVLPKGLNYIPAYAFNGCWKLTTIEIPETVTSIGEYAFRNCNSLATIKIPTAMKTIGKKAFAEYRGMKTIEIPETVTSIEEYAFDWCEKLTAIEIPKTVTSIGKYAFEHCKSLTTIEIPETVKNIGNGIIDYCSGLTTIKIPNSLARFGEYAFVGCSGMKGVEIPADVISIVDNAFKGWSGLTSVTIPSSVTSIGRSAFDGCKGLTSITIPDTVTSIGSFAFDYCEELGDVYIPESVKIIEGAAFGSRGNYGWHTTCKIYVCGKDGEEDFEKVDNDKYGKYPWHGRYTPIYLGKQN